MSGKGYKLIAVIVSKGLGSKVVAAAKLAGARGGTIIQGRGTAPQGIYETILGIAYEPEKELILVGVEEDKADNALAVITEMAQLNKPGKGVGIVMNLAKLSGIAHLQ